jgi:transcription elongation factor S-II
MANIEKSFNEIRQTFIKRVYKIIKNEITNNFIIANETTSKNEIKNFNDIKLFSIELEKNLINTAKKQCIKMGQLAKIKIKNIKNKENQSDKPKAKSRKDAEDTEGEKLKASEKPKVEGVVEKPKVEDEKSKVEDEKPKAEKEKTFEKKIEDKTDVSKNPVYQSEYIYTFTANFTKIYIGIARTILNNLSHNYIKNNGLIQKIINGNFSPYDLANIACERPQALYPEVNKKYYDFIEKQEDVSFNKKINIFSTIRCKQCKQFTCCVTQAQTRSVDEAMTTFITCLNCGYHGRP